MILKTTALITQIWGFLKGDLSILQDKLNESLISLYWDIIFKITMLERDRELELEALVFDGALLPCRIILQLISQQQRSRSIPDQFQTWLSPLVTQIENDGKIGWKILTFPLN